MINEILDCIGNKLHSRYPDRAVYREAVRQGFRLGSFFLECSGCNDVLFRGNRHRIDFKIDISIYPQSIDTMQQEKNELRQELNELLEYIDTKFGLLRYSSFEVSTSNNRRHRRSDLSGELINEEYMVFSVGYGFFYYINEDTEPMMDLTLREECENGK